MNEIKVLHEKEIKKLSTLEIVRNFNNARNYKERYKDYLSSEEVRNCDAYNTLREIKNIEKNYRYANSNLKNLNNEIVYRLNKYGKQVNLYNKDGLAIKTYVLPKTNKDNDDMAFIICKDNKSYAIHKMMYNIYTSNEIKIKGYRVDRKADNSINWKNSFIKYDIVYNFIDDYAIVEFENKYGVIDKEDKKIVPVKYDYISCFYNNFAKVRDDDKWAIINKDGEFLTKFEYDSIEFIEDLEEIDNELIIVSIDKKYGVIDSNKNVIIPTRYDRICKFDDYGLIASLNNKNILFDLLGNTLLPSKYDRIKSISKNLIEVRYNDKSGLFDKNGREITPPTYEWIEDFKKGLAKVFKNKKYGLIDESGNEVIPSIYSYIDILDDSIIRVRIDDKYGLFNRNGEPITPIKFDSLSSSFAGLIRFTIGEKEGFLNKKGVEVNPN